MIHIQASSLEKEFSNAGFMRGKIAGFGLVLVSVISMASCRTATETAATPKLPPTPAIADALASGGDISFVPNGVLWDEVHSFTYDAAKDTGGQSIDYLTFAVEPDLTASVLVVAGGGAGGVGNGARTAGGGGAGGLMYDTAVALSGSASFEVKVGKGGAATNIINPSGRKGKNSQFLSIIADGGGGGGGHGPGTTSNGGSGGSGGGAQAHDTTIAGYGTQGQGYNGSIGQSGAGGGAGAPGGDKGSGYAQDGGEGLPIAITGAEVWYAGGGAGGNAAGDTLGGSGGGGNAQQPGTNGLGGGGGGGYNSVGGTGGHGIVIIRFPYTQP